MKKMLKRKNKREGWGTLKVRVQTEKLERFKAKIPKGRRSSYIRLCMDLLEDDVKFMELMETKALKEYESWRHKIQMKKLEMEESYRKKEAFVK